LGRSRGGFSTKVHVRAEGGGKPIAFALTGGERPELEALPAVLDAGAIKRAGPGRPRLRPERVAGDRGYSSRAARRDLRRRRIGAVIPQPSNQRPCALMDWVAYRKRNAIERLIGRLKQNRRIATRYEKRAANYLAMLTIAAIRLWLAPEGRAWASVGSRRPADREHPYPGSGPSGGDTRSVPGP
jgi:transposase